MTPSTLHRDTLRFITCGSVDDGKSTLIGRLLHDVGAVPDDQVAALRDADGRLDFSLLVDGLLAEREQGITIDVAYRYFSTPRRQFIVADTPGHEQYTRNMATGASTADAAVVLIDARKGVLTQTRRHSHIVSLLGVRHVILAVTKMDMVAWSQDAFDAIVADYLSFAEAAGLPTPVAIPVSGVNGDNLARPGEAAEWYAGPTLLQILETLPTAAETARPFRMAVQGVNRPNLDFRGYTGRIASGAVAVGDAVAVSPSGVRSRVERIVVMGGDLDQAQAGQSVTLTFTDEIDVTRGDVLAAADAPLEAADQFEATIVWMAEAELIPGRVYDLKIGARTVSAQVTDIRHRVNVNTQEKLSARTLDLNDIGVCHLSLGQDVAFEPYTVDRELGAFILIDRLTRATVGAGMIHFALRRAHNIHRQAIKVDRAQRAALKGQKPAVVWFTGLSGSGKSTIANLVEELLTAEGRHAYLIDGDNLRHGLSRDLGFTEADRVENIRRAAEVARMMADAGLIVLVSLISPFRAERAMARDMMGDIDFIEVFVDAPLEVVEARDVKGLYAKARRGELLNFTGIDSPYETPHSPEIHVRTDTKTLDQSARAVLSIVFPATQP
ncbi:MULTISPECIES: adenylyl-sulfate kinase [unclassified Brevundimonas]|uniref:adenylyl-sulfate kinase n=1 Tax=unclassified Brevundimonas TaxID=2622653 RepID=UPI000CFB4491|nr:MULTISPECIES: adenylyl-sulfate kinase [unclassified Brevundimonas]PRA21250.1 adenylyl-sulfate kinase [Brevundimonas sp. MYb27]PQZ73523.1 adenylyl-sulfate kinase [Brevundimonas sp. MYb31]PRB10217.1 adenylyl-sulfate kinase [Brevundimonas sp. MYb52]PRB32214.1 adenylyl-sulfate kinase [Brevundimonas sp. MYb46]PRB44171.1 adenylyl-sulfate kinase [Brevundimonas sp. MYb33]